MVELVEATVEAGAGVEGLERMVGEQIRLAEGKINCRKGGGDGNWDQSGRRGGGKVQANCLNN